MRKITILLNIIRNKYSKALVATFATLGIASVAFYFLKSSNEAFRAFLEYVTGYGCFIYLGYAAVMKFCKEHYIRGSALILYVIMYGLYLYCNFGSSYTHISAIGFSLSTIALIYMALDKEKKRKDGGK